MNRGRNPKRSDPVCSAVFEAGELVPQDLELFQVPHDQRLVIQHHEVFFVVFCGTASPVAAAIEQQVAVEDRVFVESVMRAEPGAGLNFPGGGLLWLKQSVEFPCDLVIGGVLGCVYGDCIS